MNEWQDKYREFLSLGWSPQTAYRHAREWAELQSKIPRPEPEPEPERTTPDSGDSPSPVRGSPGPPKFSNPAAPIDRARSQQSNAHIVAAFLLPGGRRIPPSDSKEFRQMNFVWDELRGSWRPL
jgi:hypothetical protein